jgi:hypothetical protein
MGMLLFVVICKSAAPPEEARGEKCRYGDTAGEYRSGQRASE